MLLNQKQVADKIRLHIFHMEKEFGCTGFQGLSGKWFANKICVQRTAGQGRGHIRRIHFDHIDFSVETGFRKQFVKQQVVA